MCMAKARPSAVRDATMNLTTASAMPVRPPMGRAARVPFSLVSGRKNARTPG
ncbi:hypothetical protein DM44_6975 [Burkholderia cepacia]|nr:hypothetical protein DM42_6420 [Burkholderia cepacia]KGC05672.1 hypothetical protein DM44_6975 [Burkholderia cepacia]MCW3740047.1 hypothetical protein [Burkholderia cenocepacia]